MTLVAERPTIATTPDIFWTKNGNNRIVTARENTPLRTFVKVLHSDPGFKATGMLGVFDETSEKGYVKLLDIFHLGGMLTKKGLAVVGDPSTLMTNPNERMLTELATNNFTFGRKGSTYHDVLPPELNLSPNEQIALFNPLMIKRFTYDTAGNLCVVNPANMTMRYHEELEQCVQGYFRRITAETKLNTVVATQTLARMTMHDLVDQFGIKDNSAYKLESFYSDTF